jgi:hypothetical protein
MINCKYLPFISLLQPYHMLQTLQTCGKSPASGPWQSQAMEISRRVWILKSIMWSPTKCPEMGALKMLFTRKHEIFKQLWFMVDITIVNGVYKPTYNWGAPSCREWNNKQIPRHFFVFRSTIENHFTDKLKDFRATKIGRTFSKAHVAAPTCLGCIHSANIGAMVNRPRSRVFCGYLGTWIFN